MTLRVLSSPARAAGIGHRIAAALVALFIAFPTTAIAQARALAPDSLTDTEFWKFFTTMSEPDGYFLSENFVSNEVSFQEVIPSLQRSLTKSGVYLGVGPEQNFTYIANLGPRMAVIFDIRRQNAMQHLMYKAVFEMATTRAEFVSLLFSRPAVALFGKETGIKTLFDAANLALPSDSAFNANFAAIVRRLTDKHGFALPKDDIASIEHVYGVFFAAGPEVNYGYRSGNPGYVRSTYPSFGMLQAATNADSVQMGFLATEENYQAVRSLQLRNLIVPVVGDFGGPSAIRSVGKWLNEREMTVTAFYVSNVEQYLFRDSDAAQRFYGNVTALPLDTTSMFIRSVPRMSGPSAAVTPFGIGQLSPGISLTIIRDSMGIRTTQTTRDSAGVQVVRTTVDSSGVRPTNGFAVPRDSIAWILQSRRDSINRANATWQFPGGSVSRVVMGGLLTSGVASMQGTLKAHFTGDLKSYDAVINMTKVTGWP